MGLTPLHHGTLFTFTALGGYGYILGGWLNPSGSYNEYARQNMYKFYINANVWIEVALYPHAIYNQCTCADEETGRLYSSGGTHKNGNHSSLRREVYYYQASSNSWHFAKHLIWHANDHACGIVKLTSNDEKRLYVIYGYHGGHR